MVKEMEDGLRLKSGKMFCKAGNGGETTGSQPISVEVFLHRAMAPLAQE